MPIDRTEYRKMLNLDVSKVVLVTAGELSVRKNHQTLIRAISKLPSKDQYIYLQYVAVFRQKTAKLRMWFR